MSGASVLRASDHIAPSPSNNLRRRILSVVGAVFAVAVTVLVTLLAISAASGGRVSVLIGTLGSDRIAGLALVLALSCLAAGLCLIPVARPWLLLLVPARLVAIAASCLAAFAWLITSSATVVPLISAGCETGYVVEEESFLFAGSGTVYRADGILVTAVEQTSGDDGYHPFDDGAYAVEADGDTLEVWYNINVDYAAAPVSTDGEPSFTLPQLTDPTFACGMSTHARTPRPAPPVVPVYDIRDLHKGIREMAAVSIAAAVGPVVGSDGEPIDPEAITPVSTTCDEGGTRGGVALEFTTADNAGSLAGILSAWDAAGYSPDRAMQEDIRYSESLPVYKMSIRDSTSIDGLIRMQIISQCSTANE